MFMASNSKEVPTLKLNCGTLNLGKLCPDECCQSQSIFVSVLFHIYIKYRWTRTESKSKLNQSFHYLSPNARVFLASKKEVVDNEVNVFQKWSELSPILLDVAGGHCFL